MMHFDRREWAMAMLAAGALHFGIAIAVFWQLPDAGAKAAGVGGIEISLGVAGGAPGGLADPAPQAVVDETEAVVVPGQSPAARPAAVQDVAEMPAELDDIESARAAEPAVEPADEQLAQDPAAVVIPSQSTARTDSSTELPSNARMENQQPAMASTAAPGAGGQAGTRESQEVGNSASDTSAGGRPGARLDYGAVLLAWLERHKEYPHRARQRRQQGVVLLYFVVDRQGNVIEHRIRKSSGFEFLDKAATAMLERAQPLPPIPDTLRGDRLELLVPVEFFIT